MADICVKFYNDVEDERIRFVVICARYRNKWVWVKHKERETYEIAGGHREDGESVMQAACRELEEETGACDFIIERLVAYSVTGKTRVNESGEESFGMLLYAQIHRMHAIDSEIESYALFDELPVHMTYPAIQPILMAYAAETKHITKNIR